MAASSRCSNASMRHALNLLALAVLFGRITDLTTGQPLANVTVLASDGAHRTTTNAAGRYRLTGLAPGRYTLTLESASVPPQHRSAVVTANRTGTKLDLRVCSTTLDYMCGASAPGGSGSG
jgi:protocatechuate 3,4-dioxygenase beta subunit